MGDLRHCTNEEILVDILAMSKCQFFLHGVSEDKMHPSAEEFATVVQNALDL